MVLIGISTLNGCSTGAPIPPEIILFQPIIEQKFCDAQGQNCEVKSLCRKYYRDVKTGEFIYLFDLPLKSCHGVFGLDAGNVVTVKDYGRRLEYYIEELEKGFSAKK